MLVRRDDQHVSVWYGDVCGCGMQPVHRLWQEPGTHVKLTHLRSEGAQRMTGGVDPTRLPAGMCRPARSRVAVGDRVESTGVVC